MAAIRFLFPMAVILVFYLASSNGQSNRCVNPNNRRGSCISIYNCPALLGTVRRTPISNSDRNFLLASQCSNGSGQAPLVCCNEDNGYDSRVTTTTTTRQPVTNSNTSRRPTTNASPSNGQGNVFPTTPICGIQIIDEKVYSGNETSIDEFPWMALLEYRNTSSHKSLNCGGSLINQRYVLTAAHCVSAGIVASVGELTTIRLGEHDLRSEIDCKNPSDCADPIVEVGIEETIVHPGYSDSNVNRNNDIALIRLSRDVPYSGFIKPTQNSLYDKEWNKWFGEIAEANKRYTPCSKDDNCTCYMSVIESDLAPFVSKGISKDMVDKVSTHGTKYQIIDHKMYRQESCMFPSRCAGIEYFIKNIIKDLPDMELIINCRDWPQIPKTYGKYGPVFSFSKTSDYFDIMYPTWSFWEGGPAISLHPTGIGRWDKHRNIISMAAKKIPWESKKSLGFFRGSRTSDERDSIVLLSRNQPELVDAQYTKNQAWKSPKDTLNAEPAKEVSFEDHCQYKYLFNFRGVAASFRLKHLFLCKSLVFHVGDDWNEFFYFSLKPWVHYVPLKSYPTQEELASILKFFTKHDSLGKEIAHRGYKHIWNHLRMKDIECYWKKLLLDYAIILKYKVELDKNLIKIK